MPKQALEIKATLENIKSLTLDFPFEFTVRQTGGTEEREGVEVDPENEEEVFGSKGTCNFKMKFDKKDKFEATIKVISTKPLTTSDSFKQVATFETRGLDIIRWSPTTATVIAKSGTSFSDADLNDSDGFSEFDEKGNVPVSIQNLQFRFVTI